MEVVLNEEELNAILKQLGEMPAKYSLNLIQFIQQKVGEQNQGQAVEVEEKEAEAEA